MSDHSPINSDVLRAWCEAPSHFLPPEPAAAHTQQARSAGDSSPQRHRYTPAEISQQSVDLLLREYYAIVTSPRYRSMVASAEGSEGGLLQRAFLLLCPAPPSCLELDNLLKATVSVVQLAARAVALSACLIVPVLLGLIRQVQHEQGPTAAAVLAVGGLLFLLLCDQISRRANRQQAAATAACVTAVTLQQQLQAGDPSHELATLRAASKTATTSNSSRPSSITHTPRQQQPSAAAARPAGAGGGAAVGSYATLDADLAALQAALGVSVASSHAAGSREHVVEVLGQLSQQLGVTVTPDMTASPAAVAAAVAQLKQSVGI